MCILKPIYIIPDDYFYKYYNNYINKQHNGESDIFILNLLKCKGRIITPPIINTQSLLHHFNDNAKFNSSNREIHKTNNYVDEFKSRIITNNNICNVCHETLNNNYIITSCYHTFCYICANTVYYNNKKKSFKSRNAEFTTTCNHNSNSIYNNTLDKNFKCPCCNYEQTQKDLYIFTKSNDINDYTFNYMSLINSIYNTKNIVVKNKFSLNINKVFIYKYIGYKTYYILNTIFCKKKPFNIKKPQNKKIINITILISNNPNWVDLMNSLFNNNNNDNNDNKDNKDTIDNLSFCLTRNLMELLNKFINTRSMKIKYNYNLYLLEPYQINNYDNIKSNLNTLLLKTQQETEYSNIKINPFHIIIQNTIDEKIFKNKVIIT